MFHSPHWICFQMVTLHLSRLVTGKNKLLAALPTALPMNITKTVLSLIFLSFYLAIFCLFKLPFLSFQVAFSVFLSCTFCLFILPFSVCVCVFSSCLFLSFRYAIFVFSSRLYCLFILPFYFFLYFSISFFSFFLYLSFSFFILSLLFRLICF